MSEHETTTEAELEQVRAALVAAATTPAAASNETGSVSSRSVADLIALDKYLAAKLAAERSAPSSLIFSSFAFPGTA